MMRVCDWKNIERKRGDGLSTFERLTNLKKNTFSYIYQRCVANDQWDEIDDVYFPRKWIVQI